MTNADQAPDSRHVAKTSDTARPFVTRQIAGETIIVPVRDSVADLDAIYTLNEVGSRIWQLIEGPTSIEHIVRRISEEFAVTEDQAAEDTVAFLTELQAIGLIRFAGTHDEG
jgi:hypothetical protein